MNGLTYLLQVNLYLLLFYLFYLVLLRNETFFKLNRAYLVSSALLSLLIPVLRSDWVRELFVTEKVYAVTQSVGTAIIVYSAPIVAKPEGLSNEQLIWIGYAIGAGIAFLHFLRKLYGLSRSLKSLHEKQAFSFFKKVSVDQSLPEKEVIIRHELVHVKQWHSADVIFFELFTIVNWFNPVAYLYKKAIKNIHEFIADETAANPDKASYAMLLLTTTFGVQPHQLTNSFFNQSILKRRIFMLHKSKSRRAAILKYGLSAPLFAAMVILSSATLDGSETVKELTEKADASLLTKISSNSTDYSTQSGDSSGVYDAGSLEVKPLYPGGLQKFYENYQYPKKVKEAGLSGKAILSFIVEKDGSVSNIEVVRDLRINKDEDLGAGTEAVRVLREAGKWNPAMINGKQVRAHITLPIKLDSTVNSEPEGFKIDHGANETFYVKPHVFFEVNKDSLPYITIDGVAVAEEKIKEAKKEKEFINSLVPQENIYSLNILKDSFAKEKYGDNAKDLVIEITTKEFAKNHPQQTVPPPGPHKLTRPLPPLKRPTPPKDTLIKLNKSTPGTIKKVVKPLPPPPPALPNDALYRLNGKEISYKEYKKFDQKDFESVMIWKGKEAVKKFGEKGKKGVVEATTKEYAKTLQIQKGVTPDSILVSDALYFVGGKKISYKEYKAIDQNNIGAIEVWKGAEAVRKYGAEGKKGVVEIYLK